MNARDRAAIAYIGLAVFAYTHPFDDPPEGIIVLDVKLRALA